MVFLFPLQIAILTVLNYVDVCRALGVNEVNGACLEEGQCPSSNSDNSSDDDCSVYMAPSSIPNAGWGVYSAKNLKHGELLPTQDIGIPLIDWTQHRHEVNLLYNTSLNEDLGSNYMWEIDIFNGTQDLLKPGYGMILNGHEGLHNVEIDDCDSITNVYNRTDPTFGRHTDFYRCVSKVSAKSIPAGHELFLSYGDGWYLKRSKILPPKLPLRSDFDKANKMVQLFYNFSTNNLSQGNNVDDVLIQDFYDTFMNKATRLFMTKRLQNAVPFNLSDVVQVIKQYQGNVAYLQISTVVKTPSWLSENGFCLDNIRSKKIQDSSSQHRLIAIANRNIKKNNIVLPAPLMHLSRRHVEMIYTASDDKNVILWHGNQLLLNYCFGHPSSSILLFPYSPGSTLFQPASADGKLHQANIGIRWSKNMSNPEWLNLTASDLLLYNKKSGLMMEFYALKDIQLNAELYIDYGSAWYKSWQQHVDSWQKRNTAATVLDSGSEETSLISAALLNSNKTYDIVKTVPSWIQTRCYVDPSVLEDDDDEEEEDDRSEFWKDWVPLKIFKGVTYDNAMLQYSVLCKVVDVFEVSNTNNTNTYRINAWNSKTDKMYQVQGIPRDAIVFLDKPYFGNQYQQKAFRHEIQVPDDIFPESWKDLNLHHPDFPVLPTHPERSTKQASTQCGLYLAESAIPFAGLGMYTANDIRNGDRIFSSDLVIQAEDPNVNAKLRRRMLKRKAEKERSWLLRNYYWNPSNTFGEYEAEDVQSIIPGLGMLANSHTGLINAEINPPRQETYLHRSKDPGSGAVTTYHGLYFTAQGDIEAGSEIYVEYGDSWFEDREDLGDLPLSYDFELADDVIESMSQIEEIKNNDKLASQVLSLLLKVSSIRPRFYAAMPSDVQGLQHATRFGTASLSVPDRKKTRDWLEENGLCLDNIRPSLSTVTQAGKGAFATRRIKANQIVAPLPVVHLQRHHMEVYAVDDMDNPKSEVWFEGMQLLLNYVFGHPNSSLLFFPYAPVVNYINHNATKANIKLRWSNVSSHNVAWLERSPGDLSKEEHSGLVMEAVAVTDIEAGDEIFLDYGAEWEKAWADYVENWKPSDGAMNYISANELNQRNEWLKIQDEIELESNPLYNAKSANVRTVCFIPSRKTMMKVESDDTSEYDLLRYEWTYVDGLYESSNNRHPCLIMKRDDDEATIEEAYHRRHSAKPMTLYYTVEIEYENNQNNFIVEKIPRHSIQFVDKKYSSDQFVRTTFRHEIRLPDSMVPKAWMDLM